MTKDGLNPTEVMKLKELHLQLLRTFYKTSRAITPKDVIERFSKTFFFMYQGPTTDTKQSGRRITSEITDAKIYSAIKYLEQQGYIQKEESSERHTRKNPPQYQITPQGQQIILHYLSLNLQTMLDFIVEVFLEENVDKFIELGLSRDSVVGIVGPRAPMGQSILGLLAERYEPRKIYFFDLDPLLSDLPTHKSEPDLNQTVVSNVTIEFRQVTTTKDGKLRLDIGSRQVDFLVSAMVFGNFPQPSNVEDTLGEIDRVLKPKAAAIFQEINLHDSIFMWTIERFTDDLFAILPPLFYNMIHRKSLERFGSLANLQDTVRGYFSEVRLEMFRELELIYARR